MLITSGMITLFREARFYHWSEDGKMWGMCIERREEGRLYPATIHEVDPYIDPEFEVIYSTILTEEL